MSPSRVVVPSVNLDTVRLHFGAGSWRCFGCPVCRGRDTSPPLGLGCLQEAQQPRCAPWARVCSTGRTRCLRRDGADVQIGVLERHYCVFEHYPLQINMISRSKIQAEVKYPLPNVFQWNLATSLSGALPDPCSCACELFSSFLAFRIVGGVSAAGAPCFARAGSLLHPAELETCNFAYSCGPQGYFAV